MPNVSAIVLAAGLSRRFGGPNKLLEPYATSTVVGTVVQTLLSVSLPVHVVTGRDAAEVASACQGAVIVPHPGFTEGLGSSIAAGVRACPPGGGLLLVLGDMPGLRAEVVRGVIAHLADSVTIVAPQYSDDPSRPGHPVLFGADYRSELEALTGDTGARSVLEAHRDRLVLVPFAGGLGDVDTPGDLRPPLTN